MLSLALSFIVLKKWDLYLEPNGFESTVWDTIDENSMYLSADLVGPTLTFPFVLANDSHV